MYVSISGEKGCRLMYVDITYAGYGGANTVYVESGASIVVDHVMYVLLQF